MAAHRRGPSTRRATTAIDWDGLKPVYAKYLPHIGNELRVRRDAERDARRAEREPQRRQLLAAGANQDETAALGAFFDHAYKGAGVKIDEVVKDGPLDKAGMGVRPGMIIEAVDGETIAADRDLAQYLNRKAGKKVAADAGRRRQEDGHRGEADHHRRGERACSTPGGCGATRRRWSASARASSATSTCPGMNDGAYRTTFEEVMGKYATRKGIVVDTRFNGGGDLVADLAMFLSGKQLLRLHHRHAAATATSRTSGGRSRASRWPTRRTTATATATPTR